MHVFTLRGFFYITLGAFFTERAFQDSRMVLSQDEPRLISFQVAYLKEIHF